MISPRKDPLPAKCPFVLNDELYLEPLEGKPSINEYKEYANKTLEHMKFTDVYSINDTEDKWKTIQYFMNNDDKGKLCISSPRGEGICLKKVVVIKLRK